MVISSPDDGPDSWSARESLAMLWAGKIRAAWVLLSRRQVLWNLARSPQNPGGPPHLFMRFTRHFCWFKLMKWKMAVYIVKPDVNHFNTGTFVVICLEQVHWFNSELKSASKQATAIILPHEITRITLQNQPCKSKITGNTIGTSVSFD